MKNMVIAVLLVLLGAAGTYIAMSRNAGHETGTGHEGHGHGSSAGASAHPGGAASPGALCVEHGIAEARDPFCHPELLAAMGMCGEHGIEEAICFPCHPDLAPAFQAEGDWCAEHAVPESQCVPCHPELKARMKPGAGHGKDGLAEATDTAPGPITLIPLDELPRHARLPSADCDKTHRAIRFAAADVADHAGIEFAEARVTGLAATLVTNAELRYDGGAHARIASPVEGLVRSFTADLGTPVKAGSPLLVLESPALGAAKAALHEARALVRGSEDGLARTRELEERGISARRELVEAETAAAEDRAVLAEARERLLSMGLREAELRAIEESHDTSSRLTLTSPIDGVVVAREATLGEMTEASKTLVEVADASRLWAMLDVRERDMILVRQGLPVIVRVEELPGETFMGRVTWVASAVDPRTRTLPARAEIVNREGLLRANMFATAEVRLTTTGNAIVVPREAVQWEGCCNVVFVRRSDLQYEPRQVRLGLESGDAIEVREGLAPGENVVTRGSFLLKTELLKGSIGAGCCETGAPGA